MKLGDPLEPDLSFQSARLKVRWAEQNINNVNAHANEFIRRQNQSAGITADGRGIFHGETVHPFLALQAGDAIFNLRSALDCCWMGLKRANDVGADKGTLPRANTRKEVEGTVKNALVEKSFKGASKFICDTVRPYKDGNEILWFGGQVDNWNKHNMVVLTTQNTTVRNAAFNIKNSGGFQIRNCNFVGNVPGGLIRADSGVSLNPNHDTDFSTEIILVSRKPADERPLVPFLFALLKETHEAVEGFVATFGKQSA